MIWAMLVGTIIVALGVTWLQDAMRRYFAALDDMPDID